MRYLALATVLLSVVSAPPIAAQSRAESQMLLELRTLQEQVQRLQLALNQINDRVKANETLVETRANDLRKGFADQKLLIDSIAAGLRTLGEREGESAVKIAQLNQEMKAIREGLSLQQTMLNEIIGLIQPLSGAATAAAAAAGVTDPTAAAGVPTTPPAPGRAPSRGIPPSPTQYYNAAFDYFYKNELDFAVQALEDAIKRFPDFPMAARAQMTIGDSYYKMGKHFQEALTAYTATLTNYKDPDVLPDALYKQGMAYEALAQTEGAKKSYQQVIAQYPESSAAVQARQALLRIK